VHVDRRNAVRATAPRAKQVDGGRGDTPVAWRSDHVTCPRARLRSGTATTRPIPHARRWAIVVGVAPSAESKRRDRRRVSASERNRRSAGGVRGARSRGRPSSRREEPQQGRGGAPPTARGRGVAYGFLRRTSAGLSRGVTTPRPVPYLQALHRSRRGVGAPGRAPAPRGRTRPMIGTARVPSPSKGGGAPLRPRGCARRTVFSPTGTLSSARSGGATRRPRATGLTRPAPRAAPRP
jgi:hypothetical protein